ncbi:MAG TPA: cytochrome b N-terminal domain-containing protein, partial [Planctomycetaceae bacterium]|nr:cytochrome b N-terminal domain-containing protein [Planctomycetaceae bacterium]
GSALKTMLIGGSEFGNLTLTRLYTLHVVVLPVLAMVLLIAHVALMRREKLRLMKALAAPLPVAGSSIIDDFRGMEPYWPYQAARNLFVFTLLMGVVVAQVFVSPKLRERELAGEVGDWERDLPVAEISLEAPADRDIPYVARPEWYVRFLFELRHKVNKQREVLVTGALPLAVLVALFLLPFLEKILGRSLGHGLAVLLSLAGLAGAGYLTYMGYARDRLDQEFQEARRRELNFAGRALWLARQNGIPPEGPATLLQSDAKAKGALLFAAHCATCHSWNGHDGTGRILQEVVDGQKRPAVPTAADLAGFGTHEWIAGFLIRPSDNRYFGHVGRVRGGERLRNGEMVKWAAENVAPAGPVAERHLHAVAWLLAQEAERRDASAADPQTLVDGVAVFNGDLTNEKDEPLEFAQCLQCHALKSGDPDGLGVGGISPAPDLNGYGSRRWLKDFLRNPGDKRFYGKKNIMPAFDESRLSERELNLLVDWMRGEWSRPAKN